MKLAGFHEVMITYDFFLIIIILVTNGQVYFVTFTLQAYGEMWLFPVQHKQTKTSLEIIATHHIGDDPGANDDQGVTWIPP